MTLISISEAAALLGIGRTTAYRLAREGRIPCVRSFGPLRIHAERLQAMIYAEAEASIAPEPDSKHNSAAVRPAAKSGIGGSHPVQLSRKLDALLQSGPRKK
ncbi:MULTISPECIES: helix-turn-helix domain-containing protein [unclassified Pseudomonas]|uniref:helix-turn-helix domain-containing protein n=1 Tax=unclassified Pseudomonas TaxID=196821 RepID=UPI000A1E4C76